MFVAVDVDGSLNGERYDDDHDHGDGYVNGDAHEHDRTRDGEPSGPLA